MPFEAMDGGRRIEKMPLYVDVHRINNELAELGVSSDDPLTPGQLFPFDQFHYHGTDAVRAAAGLIGLGRASRVLEVGSGLGGPARYLAHTIGCRVTALELQTPLHELAATLTRRCGLESLVTHVRGDALTYPFPQGGFDDVVSWLAIHHIPNRPLLMERLAYAVRPGGRIFVEDLVERAPFSADEAEAVRQMLYGVTMTDAESLAQDMDDAGFDEIDMTDMSPSWATFCAARAAAFRKDLDRHIRVHGEEIAMRLEQFFSTVERLFASGSLGGVRIAAHRV